MPDPNNPYAPTQSPPVQTPAPTIPPADSDTEGTAAGAGRMDGVPEFARESVDWSKVKEEDGAAKPIGDGLQVSHVDTDNPTVIHEDPKYFSPDLRGHESTHVAQFARTDGVNPGADVQYGVGNQVTGMKDYDYGGTDGLIKAQQQGKHSIGNYNQEQQAAMVQDYIKQSRDIEVKARNKSLTPNDLAQYAKLQQAYHPFIQQLAPQPKGNAINTRPAAPGLPPANTPGLGVLAPDRLLGGGYVPTGRN
jgi:hypothetical protein